MKKLLAMLLIMLLLMPAALAEVEMPHELTTPDGLTLTFYPGPSGALSTSEIFVQGLYIEEKWEKAYDLNLLLAEAGDTNAMVRLGDQQLNGLGTPQDEAAAMQWYERAQAHGNRYASRCIALMYLNGWGVEADAQYAAAYTEPGADRPVFSNQDLACLYLLGYGNLEPNMEQAMYWFDQYADGAIRRRPGGVTESEYQERYEQLLASFLTGWTLPEEMFTRPSPIAWADGVPHASDAMDMGYFWHDGDGGVVDHVEAARWFEMAIEMDYGPTGFSYQSSHYALGDLYRDGSLGTIDPDRAIRHYGHATAYDRIAQMFRDGATGMDGTVYLAPDAALADAFDALDQHREYANTCAVIGDLFRTGQSPEGDAVVTPDVYLAALFYLEGFDAPHCTAQLTAMYKEGLITDPMLLYAIANNIVWSECDVSELILLLADDLIHGRVDPWLPNNEINIRYNGVSTPATLGAELLQEAISMDKLPDPAAAEALLALIPEDE